MLNKFKFIAMLLSVSITLLIVGCEEKGDINTPTDNKLCFWEVTSSDTDNKLYLFGSIHAADEKMYPLPNRINDVYEQCNAIAVECDIVNFEKDPSAQIRHFQKLILKDNSTIQDHLDKDVYTKIKKLLEDKKLYNENYEYFKPAAWLSFIETAVIQDAELDTTLGLDYHFLTKARNDNKNVHEIESVDSQVNMLTNLSDELVNFILKNYTEDYDEEVQNLKKVYSDIINGKIDSLLESKEKDSNEKEKTLLAEYNTKQLTERNKVMYDAAVDFINSDEQVFLIVGAAHMVGEDGIVKQLQNKGFTVTRK